MVSYVLAAFAFIVGTVCIAAALIMGNAHTPTLVLGSLTAFTFAGALGIWRVVGLIEDTLEERKH